MEFVKKNRYKILLWVFILAYILYFSWFSILRYKTLYASYFDLGIMNQTVHNTYRSITTGDWSKFLEQTDPMGPDQIKRMAIHNDILLAFVAPFYFIKDSPSTLLVVQTIVLALGAYFVFQISKKVFTKNKYQELISLIFAVAYLLYPGMERANIFDFHAVALATTLLLGMFYFWTEKKYGWSLLFFILSIFAKEEIALTTLFFGIYALYSSTKVEKNISISSRLRQLKSSIWLRSNDKSVRFSLLVIFLSLIWFVLSVSFIVPYFRGGHHFALKYFGDFGDTPSSIIFGVLTNPLSVVATALDKEGLNYSQLVLGPLGFLSFLSPARLLLALPEFAINLLSKNPNLRNLIYHYTSVLQPFIFISAIYGSKKLLNYLERKFNSKNSQLILVFYILIFILIYSYHTNPLPFFKNKNIHPFAYPQKEKEEVKIWSDKLKDENLKISSTGQLSPFFTSRRYFYTFSKYYEKADYVVIRLNEIYNYPEKKQLIPVYEKMILDADYQLIYQKENFEVYKRRGNL